MLTSGLPWDAGITAVTRPLSDTRRMEFRRSLFGYRRSDVDEHVAQEVAAHSRHLEEQATHARFVADQAAARRALESDLERLRAAEPLLKVNDEISALLTSFANAVSTMREQAEREAISTRIAADEYADQRRAEAERLFNEERARATAMTDDLLRRARDEVEMLINEQIAVEQAFNNMAQGIVAWVTTFDRLRDTVRLPRPGSVPPEVGARSGPHEAPQAGSESTAISSPTPSKDCERPPVAFDNGSDDQQAWAPEPIQVDPGRSVVVNFDPPTDITGGAE